MVYQEPIREAVQLPPKKRLLIDAIKLPEANAAPDEKTAARARNMDRVMIPGWVKHLSSYCRGYDDIDQMEAEEYLVLNNAMLTWQSSMAARDTKIEADRRRAGASRVVVPPEFHYYDRPV